MIITDALDTVPSGHDGLLHGHHSIEIRDKIPRRRYGNESIAWPASTFDLMERSGGHLHQRTHLDEWSVTTTSHDIARLRHDDETADFFFRRVRAFGGRHGGRFGQWRAGVQTEEEPRAHSRFPGHALTPTGVMAIRCKQFHLPDL